MEVEVKVFDPLHGITLKAILETLVAHYGWEEMDNSLIS